MVTEAKQLACELPATTGVPLSRWSCVELARELVGRGVVASISSATIWRIPTGDAIRPWFHRSWIALRDPDFAAKAGVVLALYGRVFDGEPLGDNDFVVCADEKTSIQARCRCHPTLPPGRARLMRVEHEYQRGGALAYLAAYDVHRAHVSGRCEPTTGIVPFGRLVEQVMTSPTHASAERVFWIVDNGSSHRGQASIDRLQGEWHNLRLIHLPVHASWLNQVGVAHNGMIFNVVTTENTGEVSPKNVDKSQHCCSVSTCRGDVTLRRTSRRPWLKRRSLDGVWHRQALDTVGV